jgi:predicted nucleotidyltransferase
MTDAPAQQGGQPSKAKVFISYSRKDIAFADRLDAALKARGFEPLIDRTDIYAFEEWWKRVEDLIVRADTIIFVLSPDAVKPDTVARRGALPAADAEPGRAARHRGLGSGGVPLHRGLRAPQPGLHHRAQRPRGLRRLLEEELMLTVDEAFRKFKSRLELNGREQTNASDRHNEVRDYLEIKFAIERSFLTGSYARYTKTKPLKDIDIFFELKESERHYRSKAPNAVLTDFYNALVEKYGSKAVRKQSRSVNVDFGVVVDADDNTDYRVVSVDVVPAFADGDDYEIPDNGTGKWIKTNPEIHAKKATAAHEAFSNEWKGLVRMVKYWNNNSRHGEKPVKPTFLIEVMSLECLYGGWQGRFVYELQGLFSTLADRMFDEWTDPAGLGPPISNSMDNAAKQRARDSLISASREATLAIDHARRGRNGEPLKAWRALFGPKFPLS